ncbi:hypothetical protein J7E93_18220 [Streptomyces sp. ISL-36]|uniref:hypothetical protein n=1 Tax=Streptomyces sp. ISL-36 TaxID=2819182 RepID=UPI001BEC0984|nr:hypothetical protein [Streptomyces sp. ISL-36]MBT2442006.1 hypothetical protein [Streptomyces sp. ISL-36]
MDVERVIEELYRLKPGDFVSARDGYVAQARKAKDASAAKAIAALRRPTRATWAANLLARERRDEAGQLLALGETLREAHRTLDAEQLRAAGHRRHRLIAALAREVAELARSAGQPIGDTVVHEVEQILHTVLADPAVAEEWSHGRLTAVPDAVVGFMGVPTPSVPPPPASTPPASTPSAPPPSGPGPSAPRPPAQAPSARPPSTPVASAPSSGPSRAARKEQRAAPEDEERKSAQARARQRDRVERARTAVAEADAEARRREEELRDAREAQRAAQAPATEAAERVRAVERELHDAQRAERGTRAALAQAASAVKDAERAAREAHSAAGRAARSLERVERQGEDA